MCDHCVMNSVKKRMLSRRDFFRAAAVGTGIAATSTISGAMPAMAQAPAKITDMTHELHKDFPTYGGGEQFLTSKVFDIAKDGYNLYELTINEHTGTHMDAPLHFSADGQSVAEIPVEKLVAPLCIVDIKAKAAEDANAQVTPDDLKTWIGAHGDIPQGACVAM
ncbi:MAG: cyclase family protein, partial [Roseibium sp.]|uniref:cyclase family protein n=1 Tax=Roseibium sp. TaxID=1936156 RepID=UPI0026275ED6